MDVGTTMVNRSSHIPSTTKVEAMVVPFTPRVARRHMRERGTAKQETTMIQNAAANASVAHGLVMLVATPMQKGLVMTFIEGVPLFAIAAVVWWLRPRPAGR